MMRCFLLAIVGTAAMAVSGQKFEGLALKPPMGWNSWNTFQFSLNDSREVEVAALDHLHAEGGNIMVVDPERGHAPSLGRFDVLSLVRPWR